jgi:RNA polymerase sigma-32 factor
MKGQIQALEEGDLKPDQVKLIATRLGVDEQEVINMNRRLSGDASLNAHVSADAEGEWQDWLVDDSDNQEETMADNEEAAMRKEMLTKAMDKLTDRERRVFEARKLQDDPMTLEDLSKEFDVSRERIRQIEVRAFEKVQKAVKNAAQKALAPKVPAPAGALTY